MSISKVRVHTNILPDFFKNLIVPSPIGRAQSFRRKMARIVSSDHILSMLLGHLIQLIIQIHWLQVEFSSLSIYQTDQQISLLKNVRWLLADNNCW